MAEELGGACRIPGGDHCLPVTGQNQSDGGPTTSVHQVQDLKIICGGFSWVRGAGDQGDGDPATGVHQVQDLRIVSGGSSHIERWGEVRGSK